MNLYVHGSVEKEMKQIMALNKHVLLFQILMWQILSALRQLQHTYTYAIY